MPIKEIQIAGTVKVWYPEDKSAPSACAVLRFIEILPENEWIEGTEGKIQQIDLAEVVGDPVL